MPRQSKANEPAALYFSAGSLRVRLNGAQLDVLDASSRVLATAPIELREVGSSPARQPGQRLADTATTIFAYPGARRDPLGRSAPASWINGEGRGLIHIEQQGRLIHLVLDGASNRYTSAVKITPTGFLLAAIALALPAQITGRRVCDLTRYSTFSVWRWLEALEKERWIYPVGTEQRSQVFCLTAAGIVACAGRVEAGWPTWRRSAKLGRKVAPPERRYFLSLADSDDYLSAAGDQPLIATGIESLFRDGKLMPMGSVRETAFMTTALGMERLREKFALTTRSERDFAGASEATILPENHPFFAMTAYRQQCKFEPGWPAGFAALDAIDHQDLRVCDAARSQWEQWIGTVHSQVRRVHGGPHA